MQIESRIPEITREVQISADANVTEKRQRSVTSGRSGDSTRQLTEEQRILSYNGVDSLAGSKMKPIDVHKAVEELNELIHAQQRDVSFSVNEEANATVIHNNKLDTYNSMKSDLIELKDEMSELKNASAFGVFSASSSDEEALGVSASASANEGNYSIKILSLAQAKVLSSSSYEDTTEDLGISGEILINNRSLKIRAADSLIDIRNAINTLDNGVQASILKVNDTDNRLIISAETSGEEGFFVANVGETDILDSFGFTDGTKNVREVENGLVLSAGFNSANSTIGSLAGLSAEASGTVKIRDINLDINLATDTLASIRDKINDLNIQGVTASVISETEDGVTTFRLAIAGTEDFTDDSNILESLGILERGTSGIKAEFRTSASFRKNDNSNWATDNSKFSQLGSLESETISIGGTNIDGSSLSSTFTIDNQTSIGDFLTAIEETFLDNVTASIQDGQIYIQSDVAGESELDVEITANNENGGELDFGIVSMVTRGRERLIVEGSDARILVNNIEVNRNTNEINDVLSGLSLSLKKTDPDTELTITVARNNEEISSKIEDFVKTYNEFIDFVNENSEYDKEEQTAGPLLGDLTTRTVLSRIRSALQQTVFDGDFAYNQLVQIGIETTVDGKLSLDNAKLGEAINEDVNSIISLFTATREASDNDISFSYHSTKTKSGTYSVNITRAAEMATVLSDEFDDSVEVSGVLSITDNYDSSMNVEYTEGMTLSDISNSINEEAQKTYTKILQSDVALQKTDGQPLTQNTALSDIQGVEVKEDDTITIYATNRSGRSYQRVITLHENGTTEINYVLSAIESMNNYQVNASINSDGYILLEDKTTGRSQLVLSIETTVEGLSFGNFETTQEGRNTVLVGASETDDNQLTITHSYYGSDNTFTVSGAETLGIEDGDYAGIDAAGLINGVEGTGKGLNITASNSDENARGIVIRTSITPEELETEGSSQGTITLISGLADTLYNELASITDTVDGFLQAKIDSFESSIDSIDISITNTNKRLEMTRERYVRKFTELERALAQLETLQQSLTSSLAALPAPNTTLSNS